MLSNWEVFLADIKSVVRKEYVVIEDMTRTVKMVEFFKYEGLDKFCEQFREATKYTHLAWLNQRCWSSTVRYLGHNTCQWVCLVSLSAILLSKCQ